MLFMLAMMLAPAAPPLVREELRPLAFLVGHCWRSAPSPKGEVDTHCYEAVFAGQHVRDVHEVTGGKAVYRGETIYSWDGVGKRIVFTYWNSLGGVSSGKAQPDGSRIDFGGEDYRSPEGKTIRVASEWRIAGEAAYEAVTSSPDSPALNARVRFTRVDPRSAR